MTLKDFKSIFFKELQSIFDEKEIESFFYIILEEFHQLKRIDFALQPNFELDIMQVEKWKDVLNQLKTEKPLQYILGKTEFFGLPFEVNEATLIPRPETEELVDWIINCIVPHNDGKKIKILDIGTGTGCIAISLAKNIQNSNVYAIDVSEKALVTAKQNANNNEVNVTFIHKNILETNDLNESFDIIVSNPPYVRNLEKEEIKRNVLEYEPHLALFVEDNDALLFYRKIGELAQKNLNPNGILFFEINQYLGKEMIQLLETLNFKEIELRKDIFGNDRMIKGKN